MSLQVGTLIEGSAADGTLVGRFLHVEDLVDGEGARLAEAFATFATFERFLFAVDIPEMERRQKLIYKIHSTVRK